MKAKLTASQIAEAQKKVNEIVKKRFYQSSTVHATLSFTVFFDENMTILNGNCHLMSEDRCIEFDIVYNSGYINFMQNRFYNFD